MCQAKRTILLQMMRATRSRCAEARIWNGIWMEHRVPSALECIVEACPIRVIAAAFAAAVPGLIVRVCSFRRVVGAQCVCVFVQWPLWQAQVAGLLPATIVVSMTFLTTPRTRCCAPPSSCRVYSATYTGYTRITRAQCEIRRIRVQAMD